MGSYVGMIHICMNFHHQTRGRPKTSPDNSFGGPKSSGDHRTGLRPCSGRGLTGTLWPPGVPGEGDYRGRGTSKTTHNEVLQDLTRPWARGPANYHLPPLLQASPRLRLLGWSRKRALEQAFSSYPHISIIHFILCIMNTKSHFVFLNTKNHYSWGILICTMQ